MSRATYATIVRPKRSPGLSAPALIDISHWAAEWTWLPVVERLLRTELAAAGLDVDTAISLLCTDPWQDRR